MRRDSRMVMGRGPSGAGKSLSPVAGIAWLMIIVFAVTLGWLNRDAFMPAHVLHADVAARAQADAAAYPRSPTPTVARAERTDVDADAAASISAGAAALSVRFGLCHAGGGRNCVVDGDTFWLDGEKIRIADIDTPETHPPHCPYEAALGEQATQRLRALLNAGPITLAANPGGNSHDRYGRRLAIVERDGASIGMMLVSEGLARPYAGGPRAGWC